MYCPFLGAVPCCIAGHFHFSFLSHRGFLGLILRYIMNTSGKGVAAWEAGAVIVLLYPFPFGVVG